MRCGSREIVFCLNPAARPVFSSIVADKTAHFFTFENMMQQYVLQEYIEMFRNGLSVLWQREWRDV
jgi:hypothetical protein